jgi:hypothetical protein
MPTSIPAEGGESQENDSLPPGAYWEYRAWVPNEYVTTEERVFPRDFWLDDSDSRVYLNKRDAHDHWFPLMVGTNADRITFLGDMRFERRLVLKSDWELE